MIWTKTGLNAIHLESNHCSPLRRLQNAGCLTKSFVLFYYYIHHELNSTTTYKIYKDTTGNSMTVNWFFLICIVRVARLPLSASSNIHFHQDLQGFLHNSVGQPNVSNLCCFFLHGYTHPILTVTLASTMNDAHRSQGYYGNCHQSPSPKWWFRTYSLPVQKLDASLANHTVTPRSSSGRPIRPIGFKLDHFSRRLGWLSR